MWMVLQGNPGGWWRCHISRHSLGNWRRRWRSFETFRTNGPWKVDVIFTTKFNNIQLLEQSREVREGGRKSISLCLQNTYSFLERGRELCEEEEKKHFRCTSRPFRNYHREVMRCRRCGYPGEEINQDVLIYRGPAILVTRVDGVRLGLVFHHQ